LDSIGSPESGCKFLFGHLITFFLRLKIFNTMKEVFLFDNSELETGKLLAEPDFVQKKS